MVVTEVRFVSTGRDNGKLRSAIQNYTFTALSFFFIRDVVRDFFSEFFSDSYAAVHTLHTEENDICCSKQVK